MKDKLNCLVSDSLGLPPTGRGVLDGRSFVVKDNIAIAGHVSSFGHPTWRATHKKATATAPVVVKLLEAGARMVGLTKLEQLTYSLIGNVGEGEAPVNPLYSDRFAGGSSSGSASAVAGGLADFGVGTDTGGSVRVPAAACGIYGLRPTFGRIDTTGVIPLAASFDTVGLFAREPELLRATCKAVMADSERATTSIKRVRLETDCLGIVEPAVAQAVKQAAERVGRVLGIRIEETKSGVLLDAETSELYVRLQSREIWKAHGEWAIKHQNELAPSIRSRLLNRCRKYAASGEANQQADIAAQAAYRQRFAAMVTPGTVIIKPVTPSLPVERRFGQNEPPDFRQGSFRLTSPAGLAGAPELTVPLKLPSGLTFGVGLLAAPGEDLALLDLAVQMHDA